MCTEEREMIWEQSVRPFPGAYNLLKLLKDWQYLKTLERTFGTWCERSNYLSFAPKWSIEQLFVKVASCASD